MKPPTAPNWIRTAHRNVLSTLLIAGCLHVPALSADAAADRIQPYTKNPTCWQFKGKPVLLLGGSDQDSLFNHPNLGPAGLEAHLDLLVSVGGNLCAQHDVQPQSD